MTEYEAKLAAKRAAEQEWLATARAYNTARWTRQCREARHMLAQGAASEQAWRESLAVEEVAAEALCAARSRYDEALQNWLATVPHGDAIGNLEP